MDFQIFMMNIFIIGLLWVNILETQIGIREQTGNNDGVMVEEYLRAANLKKGVPWCAAFVTWGRKNYRLPVPKNHPGYVPSWIKLGKKSDNPKRGHIGLIWNQKLKRYAHIYVITKPLSRNSVETVEGNTNNLGSREGDGVYKKIRPVKTSLILQLDD